MGGPSSDDDWGMPPQPDNFQCLASDHGFEDGESEFWGPQDHFYDCEASPSLDDSDFNEHCCQTLAVPTACRAAHKNPKKSLHVRVQVEGTDILALVDTGATSSFVQQATVKRLGLWNRVQPCQQEVRYGNREVEPMIGTVTLPVKIQGADMPMKAYVLHSKGPPLIMGFTFLEDN